MNSRVYLMTLDGKKFWDFSSNIDESDPEIFHQNELTKIGHAFKPTKVEGHYFLDAERYLGAESRATYKYVNKEDIPANAINLNELELEMKNEDAKRAPKTAEEMDEYLMDVYYK